MLCVCGRKSLCITYQGYPICYYCHPWYEDEKATPGSDFTPETPRNPVLDEEDLDSEE